MSRFQFIADEYPEIFELCSEVEKNKKCKKIKKQKNRGYYSQMAYYNNRSDSITFCHCIFCFCRYYT